MGGAAGAEAILEAVRDGGALLVVEVARLQVEGRGWMGASAWSGTPLVKAGALRPMTHAPGEKLEINARLYISIAFPVPSPLEDKAELRIEGLELEGRPVEIPPIFLQPAYSLELVPTS